MTFKPELLHGAFNLLKNIFLHGSVLRTIVYTIGHIAIAITCNTLITGADLKLATLDALVEPLINSIWYFMLDYYWATKYGKR